MNSLLLSKSSYYTMDCDVSSDRGSDHTILLATHEIVSSDDYQSSPDSIHHHHHHPHHQHHSQIHNYSLHPQSISNDDEEDDDVIFDIDQPPPLLQVEEDRDPLALDDAAEEELLRLQSPPKLDIHPPLSVLKQQHVPRINARALTLSSKEKTSSSVADTATAKPMLSSTAKSRKPASTMREVLASLPGFSVKPRRRSNKKMSTAAQIEQTKNGKIDLETPDSILVSTNLRALLNKQTFSLLPPLFQHSLVQLLPSVDRPSTIEDDTGQIRLNASALNNEFFARACLDWRERLSSGELTPENQNKLKTEAEREMSKLDPWKLKHFEPIWGDKSYRSKKISSDSTSDDRATISTAQPTTISSTQMQTHHTMTLASTPEPESGCAPPPTPETPSSQGSSGSSVVAECSDVPSSSTHSLSPCRPIMTTSSLSTSSGETNAAEITISSSNSSTSSVEIIDDYPQDNANRNKDGARKMRHSNVEMPLEPDEGSSAIENLSRRGDCATVFASSSPKLAESELEEEEFSSDLAEAEDMTMEKQQSQPNNLKYLPDNGTVLYEIEVDMADGNETSHSDEHTLDQLVGKRTSSPEERDAKQMKLCEDIEWDVVDGNEHSNQMLGAVDEIIPDGEIPMTAAEMEIFSSSFMGNSDSSVISDCSNESMPERLVDDVKVVTPPNSEDNMIGISDDNIMMDEVSLPPSPLLESVVYTDDQSSLSPSVAHKMDEENEVVVSTTVDESTRSSASQPDNHLDESNSLGDSYIEIDADEQEEDRVPFESLSKTIQISKIIQSSSSRFSQISDPVYTIQRPPTSNSPAIYRLALSPSTQLKVVSRVKSENITEVPRSPRATILKLPISSPAAPSQSSPLSLCQPITSLQSSNARGRKPTSNLPPGAVNLERSYQICQAVIQNSPNRHQFQGQLKPPPFLGSSNGGTSSGVASSVISSSAAPKVESQNLASNPPPPPVVYKVITAPRLGFPRKKIVHRQFASPTIVRRHLYATDVNLSNINNAPTTTTTLPLRIPQQPQPLPAHQTTVSLPHQQQFGQYVLIQRGNVASTSDSQVPRASSAPPAQNQQQQIHGLNGLLNNNNNNKSGGGGVRIRPASVGMNSEVNDSVQDVYVVASGSESRGIATKPISNGLAYGVDMTNRGQNIPQQIRQHHQHMNTQVFNKRVTSENTPSNCSCSLNAMVVCQKCGAYCQDDCMSSSKLCLSCTIR